MKKLISILVCLVMVIGLIPAVTMPASAVVYTDGDWQFTVSGSDACITAYKGSAADVTVPSTLHTNGGDCTVKSIDKAFYKNGTITSVTIPEGVTSIDNEAFYDCSKLAGVTLPSTLKVIGYNAFCGCGKLTDVIIPDGVTTIGMQAFYGTDLTSVKIPASVTSIGDQAFASNTNMTTLSIFADLTTIGDGAFARCRSLKQVTLPDTLTEIGDFLFDGCSGLEHFIMADGIQHIGDFAFRDCTKLNYVIIKGFQDDYDNIEISTYGNECLFSARKDYIPGVSTSGDWEYDISPAKGTVTLTEYLGSAAKVTVPSTLAGRTVVRLEGTFQNNTTVTEVTIPSSVTVVGDYAFEDCYNLEKISIPDGVTHIGFRAFAACSKLTTLQLPSNLERLETQAFYGLGITTVDIPTKLETIPQGAFEDCYSLTRVYIPASVKTIAALAFDFCSALKTVYYSDSYEDWQAIEIGHTNEPLTNAAIWYSGGSIQGTGTCGKSGKNLTWTLDSTGKLAITGTGAMADYADPAEAPWYGKGGAIETIEIGTGVTNIGKIAFSELNNLNSVTIPLSVTNIGNDAFCLSNSLTTVYYGGAVANWNRITGDLSGPLSTAEIHYGAANLSVKSLTPNKITAGPGEKITWTAKATGGIGTSYKYRFYVYRDGSNLYKGEYGKDKTFDYTVTDPGIYTVRVYVKDESGVSVSFTGGDVAVGPAAPTNVKLISSLQGIKVTWNAVSGASKYRVVRTGDGNTTKVKVTGTSYMDTTVEDGVSYTYYVQAQSAGGIYSAGSETKSLYYPLGIAVKVSGQKANVSWTPVAGATKYQMYRRQQAGGKYGEWELKYSGKGTSFVDTPGNGTWQYRVRAVMADGVKTPYSNRKKITIS